MEFNLNYTPVGKKSRVTTKQRVREILQTQNLVMTTSIVAIWGSTKTSDCPLGYAHVFDSIQPVETEDEARFQFSGVHW